MIHREACLWPLYVCTVKSLLVPKAFSAATIATTARFACALRRVRAANQASGTVVRSRPTSEAAAPPRKNMCFKVGVARTRAAERLVLLACQLCPAVLGWYVCCRRCRRVTPLSQICPRRSSTPASPSERIYQRHGRVVCAS